MASSPENRPSGEAEEQRSSLQRQSQDWEGLEDWEEDDNNTTHNNAMPARSVAHSQQPLLKDNDPPRESNTFAEAGDSLLERPQLSRRSTFRSLTPNAEEKNLTRRKYVLASGFLLLSLVSFVIQTETAVYIQHDLGWDKPYCML